MSSCQIPIIGSRNVSWFAMNPITALPSPQLTIRSNFINTCRSLSRYTKLKIWPTADHCMGVSRKFHEGWRSLDNVFFFWSSWDAKCLGILFCTSFHHVQNCTSFIFCIVHVQNWACFILCTWDFQQCGMCDQQSLRSACAYAQSDQRFC